MPAATAAAAPPEDPPGVFAGFHGLRVTPVSGLSVTPFQPNSGRGGLAEEHRAVPAAPAGMRHAALGA